MLEVQHVTKRCRVDNDPANTPGPSRHLASLAEGDFEPGDVWYNDGNAILVAEGNPGVGFKVSCFSCLTRTAASYLRGYLDVCVGLPWYSGATFSVFSRHVLFAPAFRWRDDGWVSRCSGF